MTVLLVILGFAATLALMILKALAVDQVRGQIQRRIIASVETTIASLPQELAAEWEDEWRAELAALISMPVTAALYARGLRQSASQLKGMPQRTPSAGRLTEWIRRSVGVVSVAAGVAVTAVPVSTAVMAVFGPSDVEVAIGIIAANPAAVAVAVAVVIHRIADVLGVASVSVSVSVVVSTIVVACLGLGASLFVAVAVGIGVGVGHDLVVGSARKARAHAKFE